MKEQEKLTVSGKAVGQKRLVRIGAWIGREVVSDSGKTWD